MILGDTWLKGFQVSVDYRQNEVRWVNNGKVIKV
jgi:hypothetical protein